MDPSSSWSIARAAWRVAEGGSAANVAALVYLSAFAPDVGESI
jgi:hypothetical protein